MAEEHTPPDAEREARRERIRRWYDEAKALGVSDDAFYAEMTPIVGLEELEHALAPDED